MRRIPYVYTLNGEEWAAYKAAMRAEMIACAREKRTITYSELAQNNPVAYLHPHSFTFAHIMRQICAEEFAQGNGQLCALVVSKATGMPGGGYFRGMATIHDTDADLEARWRQDLEQVFILWELR
ncbi:MAG: hypothetical protein SF162_15555 [bacterium]|nr:hypothetical protein [bacterium]